jgi:hypothetical protein
MTDKQEWVAQAAERARKRHQRRKAQMPKDDYEETLRLLAIVSSLNILALVAAIMWMAA